MSQNFLQLNAFKTEILIIAQDSANSQIPNSLSSLSHSITQHCRNLGVIFYQNLSLDKHIKSMVQSYFYHHLRNESIRLLWFLAPWLSVKNPSSVSSSPKTLLPWSWLGLRNMMIFHRSWLPYTGYLFIERLQLGLLDFGMTCLRRSGLQTLSCLLNHF